MAKKKTDIWFGCGGCGYKPPMNEDKSNENWSVFKCGVPCPNCGGALGVHIAKGAA